MLAVGYSWWPVATACGSFLHNMKVCSLAICNALLHCFLYFNCRVIHLSLSLCNTTTSLRKSYLKCQHLFNGTILSLCNTLSHQFTPFVDLQLQISLCFVIIIFFLRIFSLKQAYHTFAVDGPLFCCYRIDSLCKVCVF